MSSVPPSVQPSTSSDLRVAGWEKLPDELAMAAFFKNGSFADVLAMRTTSTQFYRLSNDKWIWTPRFLARFPCASAELGLNDKSVFNAFSLYCAGIKMKELKCETLRTADYNYEPLFTALASDITCFQVAQGGCYLGLASGKVKIISLILSEEGEFKEEEVSCFEDRPKTVQIWGKTVPSPFRQIYRMAVLDEGRVCVIGAVGKAEIFDKAGEVVWVNISDLDPAVLKQAEESRCDSNVSDLARNRLYSIDSGYLKVTELDEKSKTVYGLNTWGERCPKVKSTEIRAMTIAQDDDFVFAGDDKGINVFDKAKERSVGQICNPSYAWEYMSGSDRFLYTVNQNAEVGHAEVGRISLMPAGTPSLQEMAAEYTGVELPPREQSSSGK